MAHRWQNIIKAYADGIQIQYRVVDKEDNYESLWFDVLEEGSRSNFPNFNRTDYEWRIKPESEPRFFRVALILDKKTNHYCTESFDSQKEFDRSWKIAHSRMEFVQWLTDWVKYDVEGPTEND